jgi:hypothetical protein
MPARSPRSPPRRSRAGACSVPAPGHASIGSGAVSASRSPDESHPGRPGPPTLTSTLGAPYAPRIGKASSVSVTTSCVHRLRRSVSRSFPAGVSVSRSRTPGRRHPSARLPGEVASSPVASSPATSTVAEAPTTRRAWRWADLMRRVFAIDVLACVCGARLRFVATIEDPPVVQRILRHLGLPSETPVAAPRARHRHAAPSSRSTSRRSGASRRCRRAAATGRSAPPCDLSRRVPGLYTGPLAQGPFSSWEGSLIRPVVRDGWKRKPVVRMPEGSRGEREGPIRVGYVNQCGNASYRQIPPHELQTRMRRQPLMRESEREIPVDPPPQIRFSSSHWEWPFVVGGCRLLATLALPQRRAFSVPAVPRARQFFCHIEARTVPSSPHRFISAARQSLSMIC